MTTRSKVEPDLESEDLAIGSRRDAPATSSSTELATTRGWIMRVILLLRDGGSHPSTAPVAAACTGAGGWLLVRPLDPRLLRHARSTRRFLAVTVVIGVLTAGLVITQAFVLARILVAGFQEGASLADERSAIVLLAILVLGRAALAWATESSANASSAQAKSELRAAVLDHAVRLGPVWLAGTRSGELTTLSTRGVDALDGYYARYLPQLVLACIVPVAVVVAIATQDLLSAVLVALTLPLIPLFMVIIGTFTRRSVDRQWSALAMLSGHFLDVVAGLPTLKAFGRSKAQTLDPRRGG